MKKALKTGIVVAVVVSALTVFLAGSAIAQDPPSGSGEPHAPGAGWNGGLGNITGDTWVLFDAAAEALDLSPVDLFTELHSGKSLADVAEEQGVDMQVIQEAQTNAQIEAIQAAVEDGTLTQEDADRMLERLQAEPSSEPRESLSEEEMIEASKEAIQEAVDDGTISQEQADWMLEGIENGWMMGGLGGFSGPHGGGPGGPGPNEGDD